MEQLLESSKDKGNVETTCPVCDSAKDSCADCLKKENPHVEILPHDYIEERVERLGIEHLETEFDEEDRFSAAKTARFKNKPSVVSATSTRRSTPSRSRAMSKGGIPSDASVTKTAEKIKHEKQAKMIFLGAEIGITLLFVVVIIVKWNDIMKMIGI